MACNPCCCSDCIDVPKQLVIHVSYPGPQAVDGKIIGQKTEEIDGETVLRWADVFATCEPRPQDVGIAAIRTISNGGGYTQAPTVSLSPNAGGAVIQATVESPIRKITVTSPGSGYASPPSVIITAPAGGLIRKAAATAVIEGPINSITLTVGGLGYESVPTVEIAGGGEAAVTPTLGDGFVKEVSVTNGGRGYSSPPQVEITGNAEAAAFVSGGAVTKIVVTNKGSGYSPDSPPTVLLQGGGGNGAEAALLMGYSVISLKIDQPGDNYPPNPAVAFAGGNATISATATATINGRVKSIELTDAGAYADASKSSDPAWRRGWPTISLSPGPATAKMEFEGGVEFGFGNPAEFNGGGVVSEPPAISVSGTGTGAEAETILSWQQSRSIVLDLTDCEAVWSESFCSETTSQKHPPAPCFGCGGTTIRSETEPPNFYRYGEGLSCLVRAGTALGSTASFPSQLYHLDALDSYSRDFLFAEEGVWAYVAIEWSIEYFFIAGQPDVDEKIYINRNFSRVQPSGAMTPFELLEAEALGHSNVTLGLGLGRSAAPIAAPLFERRADRKGDVYWVVVGLQVLFGGANLRIEAAEQYPYKWLVHSGNLWPLIAPPAGIGVDSFVTPQWSAPVVGEENFVVFGVVFSVQPSATFGFSQAAVGDYILSQASVSGGTTSAANGTYAVSISFRLGYADLGGEYRQPQVNVVISDGQVASAEIIDPGLIRGPATIASVSLPEEPNDIQLLSRFFTGRSTFGVTLVRSVPTVTATPAGQGSGALLLVTVRSIIDQNGLEAWEVDTVSVTDPGSGYAQDGEVRLATDGVTVREASGKINLPARSEPTLEASIGGPAELSVSYTEVGDIWEIAGVSVLTGGGGYSHGQPVSFTLGEDDVENFPASATAVTEKSLPTVTASVSSGSGAALSVQLQQTTGGWEVSSVSVSIAGTGYTDGEQVSFSGPGEQAAFAIIAVGQDGEITAVNVFVGGLYFVDTGVLESVDVQNPGSYHKQETTIASVTIDDRGEYYGQTETETNTPLVLSCLGPLDSWEQRILRPVPPEPGEPPPMGVGDSRQFDTLQVDCWKQLGGSEFINLGARTRVCGKPTISLEYQS